MTDPVRPVAPREDEWGQLIAKWRETAQAWEDELERTYGKPLPLRSQVGSGRANIQNWVNWLRGVASDVEALLVAVPVPCAPDENPCCSECGGPHPYDTSVPSAVWNRVIRAHGLPEYLCLTCIVKAFGCFGESFTATLIGGPFQGGLPIEVRIHGHIAQDAVVVGDLVDVLAERFGRELYKVPVGDLPTWLKGKL